MGDEEQNQDHKENIWICALKPAHWERWEPEVSQLETPGSVTAQEEIIQEELHATTHVAMIHALEDT